MESILVNNFELYLTESFKVFYSLVGDLLFTSDNVNEYDDLDWKRLDQLILLSKCTTTNVVNLKGQTYRIDFTSEGKPCHAFVNFLVLYEW